MGNERNEKTPTITEKLSLLKEIQQDFDPTQFSGSPPELYIKISAIFSNLSDRNLESEPLTEGEILEINSLYESLGATTNS